MSQTYEQYVADVKADMASEGCEQDISIFFDIADSLLFDAEFATLAKKRFPMCSDKWALKEAVALTLY